MRASESVLSGILIACAFFGGVKYSLYELNEETSRWANQYKETDDKVSAFVEVSNPKTIVSYVKQLRDILDNMTRLSRIIDKGEEIDLVLVRLEKEYKILEDKLINLTEDHIETTEDARSQRTSLSYDLDESFESMEEMDNTIQNNNLTLIKKFDQIENDLRDIKDILNDIENSKIGKKIWKQ